MDGRGRRQFCSPFPARVSGKATMQRLTEASASCKKLCFGFQSNPLMDFMENQYCVSSDPLQACDSKKKKAAVWSTLFVEIQHSLRFKCLRRRRSSVWTRLRNEQTRHSSSEELFTEAGQRTGPSTAQRGGS